MEYNLTLAHENVNADCINRLSITINGQFPGPEIRVRPGDILALNVHNGLFYEGATLHLHGLHARNTPQYDGVAYGTQWPILPGKTFTYRQIITNGPGTFWYHAHYQLQSQAIYGPLIIEDPNGAPYQYDDERTLMLGDWYHRADTEQLSGLLSPQFKAIGDPQSLLINGRGRFNNGNCTHLEECTKCPELSQILVNAGRTYRLRLIGSTSLSYLSFHIQNHTMTLIEMDGIYINPVSVTSVQLNSGQRVSVLVTMNQVPGRAYPMTTGIRWRQLGPAGYGYLSYSTVPLSMNTTLLSTSARESLPSRPNWIYSNISMLSTYGYPVMPPQATKQFILSSRQHNSSEGHIRWMVNGASFEIPTKEPLLMAAYEGRDEFYSAIPKASRSLVFEIQHLDVVDIVLQNTVSLSRVCLQHPWHLHGHHFWELGSGPGNYTSWLSSGTIDQFFYKTPFMRDTTTVYPYASAFFSNETLQPGSACGFKILRFVADNPGIWNFHCHITAHMHMGMMAYFAESLDQLPQMVDGSMRESGNGMGRDVEDLYEEFQQPPDSAAGSASFHVMWYAVLVTMISV